jgi:dienelactone hydrolase
MPLALAVLAPDEALDVMAANPTISSWVIGGHSLGGAMAARFAYTHPEDVDGLVLWAAYPASTDDLSEYDVTVTSIFGTLDGLATGDKIDASRPLLPPDTRWVPIEGGNHAQFGDYGAQAGDGVATISPAGQQAQAAEATVDLLEEIVEAAP